MKRQNFDKYIGFNLEIVSYDALREEAYTRRTTVSELLRTILKERLEVTDNAKQNA